ncbi:hypothetical protein Pla52o_35390 [Novipirellula galeiformis]|uniref:Uncharacterized protein n=1 Tax=Novipirellula galeiformis TaxID=2528004 RepID=A0A5C6CCF9_9BACT|nr:hypothetical protein Pla52o_35390 [Novipirellula galeiformis]
MGDPNATLELLRKKVACKECGEIRVNTPSGSVCPNGHGRIFPPVEERDRERYCKRMNKANKNNGSQ